MPELVEVEIYRRSVEPVVGRRVEVVHTPDSWFLKGGVTPAVLEQALVGASVKASRRLGKLLMVDVGDTTLGLRFGMTGRIVVDGHQPIERLLYSTVGSSDRFVRFGIGFDDGSQLSIIDPRRLGGVELAPDESALGPDAATVSKRHIEAALRGRRSLKAVLLDQSRIAGIGNLICDETLWRVGLDPTRPVATLTSAEKAALARAIRETVGLLTRRGGSHLGDLQDQRVEGGVCPRDGAPLRRAQVGGRTTYWCPHHQR